LKDLGAKLWLPGLRNFKQQGIGEKVL